MMPGAQEPEVGNGEYGTSGDPLLRISDRQADDFLAAAYHDLKRLARSRMAKERPGQTLQPAALVHEAYLRILGTGDPSFQNEAHFFAAVAEAMRRILVERARRRGRVKHGGGRERTPLEGVEASEPSSEDIVGLDQVLRKLEAADPRLAEIVKLHYFAGLTFEEISAALRVAERTVYRQWSAARAWLRLQLERPSDGA
ncbi:MAG: ECF-type sigma factor [Phycisphaerales bacterium]